MAIEINYLISGILFLLRERVYKLGREGNFLISV